MNDYMEDAHGKEIDLQKTTIKIPGANKPRIGKSLIQVDTNRLNNDIHSLNINAQYNSANSAGSLNEHNGKNGFSIDEHGNQLASMQPGLF